MSNTTSQAGIESRRVALEALRRIEADGAFANLVLDKILERSGLATRDKNFVTHLVYGVTRQRRNLDFVIDRFIARELDATVRNILRLGTYQIRHLNTPVHAAVDTTVRLASNKTKGFINAVMRKIAAEHKSGKEPLWPSPAIRLSYPDWIVTQFTEDLGSTEALKALAHMNEEPEVTLRDDGYIQDRASSWVAEELNAKASHLVLDCCAAPGGKATLIAQSGATVIASDRRLSRTRLVKSNFERVSRGEASLYATLVADASELPFGAVFDRVLVDAPCSGLGVLHRRADARWRIEPEAPQRLSELQSALLTSAAKSVKVGGEIVYSVCTLSAVETLGVAAVLQNDPCFEPVSITASNRWTPFKKHQMSVAQTLLSQKSTEAHNQDEISEGLLANGGFVAPHKHNTDGMALFKWRRVRR